MYLIIALIGFLLGCVNALWLICLLAGIVLLLKFDASCGLLLYCLLTVYACSQSLVCKLLVGVCC